VRYATGWGAGRKGFSIPLEGARPLPPSALAGACGEGSVVGWVVETATRGGGGGLGETPGVGAAFCSSDSGEAARRKDLVQAAGGSPSPQSALSQARKTRKRERREAAGASQALPLMPPRWVCCTINLW
jgi:hypothetical protein